MQDGTSEENRELTEIEGPDASQGPADAEATSGSHGQQDDAVMTDDSLPAPETPALETPAVDDSMLPPDEAVTGDDLESAADEGPAESLVQPEEASAPAFDPSRLAADLDSALWETDSDQTMLLEPVEAPVPDEFATMLLPPVESAADQTLLMDLPPLPDETAFFDEPVLPPFLGDESTSLEDETGEAEEETPRRRLMMWVWIGLAVGVLLAAGALGYAWWYTNSRLIPVPSLVGKLPTQAVQTLNDAGLRLGKVTEVATETAPVGTVIAQEPKAASELKPGGAVSLVVASAPLDSTVPDVTAKSPEEAARILAGAKLAVRQYDSYDPTVANGQVAAQIPGPDTKLEPGATVLVFVSKGPLPADTRVPQLKELGEADAKTLLEAAHLRFQIVRSFDPSITAGVIMAQHPEPNQNAPYNSVVQFSISQGPGTRNVVVPKVISDTEASAKSRLTALGLAVDVMKAHSPSVAEGNVISQMPADNVSVGPGSTVGIVVSTGSKNEAAAPSLAGLTKAEAEDAVKKAGLEPKVLEISAPGQEAGRVFGQYPAASVSWPRSLSVYIAVAR